MRTTQRRVERLEQAAGGTGHPALVVAMDAGDGVLRDPLTGAPLVPPPGAQVIVFTERADGPQ